MTVQILSVCNGHDARDVMRHRNEHLMTQS